MYSPSLHDNVMDNVSNDHMAITLSVTLAITLGIRAHRNSSRNKRYLVANNHTAFRNTISSRRKEEECHSCMEKITKGQFLVFKLPCCGHYSHTECFKTWASVSHKESTVRCAYCRTIYPEVLPLFARIHRKTHLHNVLSHKSSHRMLNRPHNSTLAANVRSFAGMRTAH